MPLRASFEGATQVVVTDASTVAGTLRVPSAATAHGVCLPLLLRSRRATVIRPSYLESIPSDAGARTR